MYDVFNVAKWFLSYDRLHDTYGDSEGISNSKLQRLLYYAQGTFLALKDEKLFSDNLLAWTYGPAVERVYAAYKDFESRSIDFCDGFGNTDISEDDESLLKDVYDSFAGYAAWKLCEMSRSEDPWLLTVLGAAIDEQLIKDYFVREVINWEEYGANRNNAIAADSSSSKAGSMRELIEIVEEAKDGGRPSYDELRYALVAYDALLTFAGNDVLGLYDPEKQEWYKEIVAREHFRRLQQALVKSPKEWLGSNDPDNPVHQAGRAQSKNIIAGLQKKIGQRSADENKGIL